MNKLIIVRHGEEDPSSGHLLGIGKRQIMRISKLLESNAGKTALLTSPIRRARQSADIIGKLLNIQPQEHEVLASVQSGMPDMFGALELVRSQADMETVILVTHHEQCLLLPQYFAQQMLKSHITTYGMEKGYAVVIDLVNKQSLLLK